MNKAVFVITLLLLFVSLPAYAAETQKVDYPSLESLGLLQSDDASSLGAGVYHNANRSELVYLLKNLNRSEWVNVQNTIKNLLLTASDSSAITNDIAIETGQDLLTLRLTALLRMGYYQEAFTLYNDASAYTLPEPTIRAGIFSMLFNKEKARACLEVKTSFAQYREDTFWKEANAYCTLSLSHDPIPEYHEVVKESQSNILKTVLSDKEYIFEYDIKAFKSLSAFERAILIAEDRVVLPPQKFEIVKHIPPQHIAPLLMQTRINEDVRSLLSIHAVKYGILSTADLSNLYTSILEKYKDAKPKGNDWYTLAALFNDTKVGWLPKDRKDQINEAFDIADKYDDAALLPLLPAIAKMTIGDELSLLHAERATKLFFYNQVTPPEDWIEDLAELSSEDEAQNASRLKLLTALSLITDIKGKSLKATTREQVNKYLLSSDKKAALKNIIENIDTSQNNGDKVRYIETNGFDLNWNNSYTMPPYVVLRALAQSSKNQDMSVSLLLTGFILENQNGKDVYVGTIDHVVNALAELGLKQQSDHLLAQAVMMMKN